jgi:hypothetical protein
MTKACLLALVSLLAACDKLDNCPDELDPIPVDTGRTDTDALVYESAAWDGPLEKFPPETDLHFIHDLGVVPTLVKTYLAFSSKGTGEGDVTENAGNQGRIQCVDAKQIVVTNDTCEEDFYIRVVAFGAGSSDTTISCKDAKAVE